MGNQWSSGRDTRRTPSRDNRAQEEIALSQLLDDAQYLLQLSSDRHSRQARDLSRLLDHARRTLHPAFFPISLSNGNLGLPTNRNRCLPQFVFAGDAIASRNSSPPPDRDHRLFSESIVRDASPVKDLGMLLDDERYLVLVFDHLIDYGLQDCRLVCKAWYEACKNFPINLGKVTRENFGLAVRGFPQAYSLSIELSDVESDFAKWSRRLSRFQNLGHLKLQLSISRPTERFGLFLRPLQRLKKLDLALQDFPALTTVYSSLQHLTKLTMLGIKIRFPVENLDRKVFLELEAIQELAVPITQYVNLDGSRRFPGLTNLTELNISPWPTHRDRDAARRLLPNPAHFYVLFLQAIVSHASTLRSLRMYVWLEHKDIDFSPLLLLTRLKKLEVDTECPAAFGCFQETLDRMESLESYSIHCQLISTTFPRSRLLLSYSQNWIAVDAEIVTPCESNLAYYSGYRSRSFFTASKMILHAADLLDSSISFWRRNSLLSAIVEFRLRTGLNGEADGLTDIERLTLKYPRFSRPLVMRSRNLRGLEDLKSLTLEGVDSDKFLFQELAALSKLTSLHMVLSSQDFVLRSILSDVSLVTSLNELKLRSRAGDEAVETLNPKRLNKIDRFMVTSLEKEHRFTKKASSSSLSEKDHHRPSLWLSRLK